MGVPGVLPSIFLLTLTYGFCFAGVPGTEFISTFMQNQNNNTGSPDLKLSITALSDSTAVTIWINKSKFRKDIRLNQLEQTTVDLPSGIQVLGSDRSSYSVIVSSNKPISVLSINFKDQSSDSSFLYPVMELGTEYYVVTPAEGPKGSFKEFSVVAKEPTSVTIYPTGTITYEGQEYHEGNFTFNLEAYEAIQFQSVDDLSGSKVQSTNPVAVLSGHTCSWLFTKCSHVYEQLQPVSSWGTEFLITPISFQTKYDLVYVAAASQKTKVTYQVGHQQTTEELKTGDVLDIKLKSTSPLFIRATDGIQVLFYCTGILKETIEYGTFLVSVPDVTSFCTSYQAAGQNGYSNIATVVAKNSGLKGLTVDKAALKDVRWEKIPEMDYSWGVTHLTNSKFNLFENSKSPFKLSILGTSSLNIYGETGICVGGYSRGSCSNLKCREKEVCKIRKGQAVCQGTLDAVCWASGDPHYHTFDGKNYNFQGTCSYTMAKTCGPDLTLPSFNIETVNENRGSSLVSYLKSVNIQVYGYNITGVRSEFGVVRVNNQKAQFPVILNNGKLTIFQSGSYLVLQTDFNLKVIYDWNVLLKIKVSSSFHGNVCGLCGNYNDDPNDDLSPKESGIVNLIEFGQHWKVQDSGDDTCLDGCIGECNHFEEENKRKYGNNEFCGIIDYWDGPFIKCREKMNPQTYKDNCIYDMCLNDGYHQILCQSLKQYSDACAQEGINPGDWRNATGCNPECPPNSSYKPCGGACPATCQDPQAPLTCTEPCIETCECDPGFVLVEGKCVNKTDCGCFYEGRSYGPNASFWEDTTCKRKCICNPVTHKVECNNTKCASGEQCLVKDGIRDCYPVSFVTCSASGDPHYATFDNFHYDFQGACQYLLSGLCKKKSSLTDFQVIVRNDNLGSLVVSYTTGVKLRIFGRDIALLKEYKDAVLVDGIKANLPLTLKSKADTIDVFQSGRQCIIQTNVGIRVTFDWEVRVGVTLPSTYAGSVCGLCGNFNNNSKDDLISRNSTLMSNISQFGHSWREGIDSWREGNGVQECKPVKEINCPNLLSLEGEQKKKLTECGMLLDTNGPFRECHAKIKPDAYFQDCVYDMCEYGRRTDLICRLLAGYTASCQEAGAVVHEWRSDNVCPISCPLNSRYNVCSSGCPSTCLSMLIASKCDALCREGCQCDKGYVLSGAKCVPMSQCGCRYNEQYYKLGDIFYPENTCEKKCTCNNGGAVICESTSCGPYEECSVVKGVQSCNPVGTAVCSAIGKTTYNTFDNFGYDFSGNCSYILTKTCLTEGSKLTPYLVRMRNLENNGIFTREIIFNIYSYTITMTTGSENKMLVNDIIQNLPFELETGKVRADYQGGGIVLTTDFGLKIMSDSSIHITVPGNYHNQMCGLCGNYNDDATDELSLTDNDAVDFAESWKETNDVCSTSGVCSARNESCTGCTKYQRKQLAGENFCGFLTASSGPFAACNSAVNASDYLNSCINALCARTGEDICTILQGYVTVCRDAGVIMKPWRSPSFCAYNCPDENSHYEFCANRCSTSCSSLYDSAICPKSCFEGCQCNTGYLSHNKICVTPDNCGCFMNSTYYKPNEEVVTEDCTQICYCTSDQLMHCQSYNCASDERCQVLEGKTRCVKYDPCDPNPCRAKEQCERRDGNSAVCVPRYTSTCTGWGDPHYTTFDNYNFDFHGTCTYVLACYIGFDTTLEYFHIEEKNDRESPTSSSVRLVNVFVYNFTISILKDEFGQVRVNDEIKNLPLTLVNGKIFISQSGTSAVLSTDFGLKVTCDHNWYVEITLPSSYYGTTGGLCGNFNGDLDDDKMSPENQIFSEITEWARSWKVNDEDLFCWDNCQGNCLACDGNKERLHDGEQFCEMIKAPDGPFRKCHSAVSTDIFFENCVKDFCSHGGIVGCQTFEAYATMCRKKEVILYDWRYSTGCNMSCPENSHYEPCANGCPATCLDRQSPDRCTEPCKETCQCNDGYISSAGDCIPVTNCDCIYKNVYYKPNQEFWSDDKCNVLCTCNPNLGMVECKDKKCQDNEKCMLRNGVRDCYPVSYSTCAIAGDPHYTTFDGKKYNFMGTCTYQLTEVCHPDPNLTYFQVKVQNDKRGGKDISYTKSVTLEVYNQSITLTRDYPQRILVNGVVKFLPLSLKSNKIKAFMKGEHAFIRTDFDVIVNYNWDNYARVMVPSTYSDALCGLSGNFNKDPSDDLTPTDNKEDGIKFEDRYKVGETPGCTAGCVSECPKCSEEKTHKYSSQKYCGILSQKDGPFSACYEVIDPTSYFTDCVFDSCQYQGRYSAVCGAIAIYVTECQEKGIKIEEWRTYTICNPVCSPNSHYELCGPGCHATCSNLNSATDCQKTCTEGCYCDNGFVLSGDTCVSISECGCDFNNSYYQKGQTFYPEDQCNEQCQCVGNGEVQCQATPCGPNEECKVVNGVICCHSKTTGTCLTAGNSHFISFDGLNYNLQGSCSYTLAEVCTENWELGNFSVVAESGSFGKSGILGIGALKVYIYEYEITVERGTQWKVKVNEENHILPLVLEKGKIQIHQEGSVIILQTDFDLFVLYDSVNSVHITVPGVYQSAMCGLCGDFNGQSNDDLRLPSRQLSTSEEEFGAAWTTNKEVKDCQCKEHCKGCDELRAAIFTQDEACGLFLIDNGPFADCYQLVNVTDYFNQCLFDMCASDGQAQILCESLQAYSTACQAAGAKIKSWRSPNFCPLECPENSHYELCTHTCDVTCSSITTPGSCTGRCSEGCECDEGYLFDGGHCVSMDHCGCFYNGRSYKLGDSVVSPDCLQRCTCEIGGVLCRDFNCSNAEYCGLEDGTRGCFEKRGTCTLSAGGRLMSFDKLSGSVAPDNTFDFASVCDLDLDTWFRLVVITQSCKKDDGCQISAVHAYFPDFSVAVTPNGEAWVNGRPVDLPYTSGIVTVESTHDGVLIRSGEDMDFVINENGDLTLSVNKAFSGSLCSACGNFNRKRSDDLKGLKGKSTSNFSNLIGSWRAKDFAEW